MSSHHHHHHHRHHHHHAASSSRNIRNGARRSQRGGTGADNNNDNKSSSPPASYSKTSVRRFVQPDKVTERDWYLGTINESTWGFTAEQIEKTPSVLYPNSRGLRMSATEERLWRSYACNLINTVARDLQLPQLTIATASVYFHCFFTRYAMQEHDFRVVALACLFLAGKVEETQWKLEKVLEGFGRMFGWNPRPTVALALRKRVLDTEMLVLGAIEFKFTTKHPYMVIREVMRVFQQHKTTQWRDTYEKDLVRHAWYFLNDALMLPLLLQYDHVTMGVAAVYMALSYDHLPQPVLHGASSPWYHSVYGKDIELLEHIRNRVMTVYRTPVVDEAAARKLPDHVGFPQRVQCRVLRPKAADSSKSPMPTASSSSSVGAKAALSAAASSSSSSSSSTSSGTPVTAPDKAKRKAKGKGRGSSSVSSLVNGSRRREQSPPKKQQPSVRRSQSNVEHAELHPGARKQAVAPASVKVTFAASTKSTSAAAFRLGNATANGHSTNGKVNGANRSSAALLQDTRTIVEAGKSNGKKRKREPERQPCPRCSRSLTQKEYIEHRDQCKQWFKERQQQQRKAKAQSSSTSSSSSSAPSSSASGKSGTATSVLADRNQQQQEHQQHPQQQQQATSKHQKLNGAAVVSNGTTAAVVTAAAAASTSSSSPASSAPQSDSSDVQQSKDNGNDGVATHANKRARLPGMSSATMSRSESGASSAATTAQLSQVSMTSGLLDDVIGGGVPMQVSTSQQSRYSWSGDDSSTVTDDMPLASGSRASSLGGGDHRNTSAVAAAASAPMLRSRVARVPSVDAMKMALNYSPMGPDMSSVLIKVKGGDDWVVAEDGEQPDDEQQQLQHEQQQQQQQHGEYDGAAMDVDMDDKSVGDSAAVVALSRSYSTTTACSAQLPSSRRLASLLSPPRSDGSRSPPDSPGPLDY